MKFAYIGDPKGGPCLAGQITYRNGVESVTYRVGVPTETPAWLEKRLAGNNHFQAVDEREAEQADESGSEQAAAAQAADKPAKKGKGKAKQVADESGAGE